MNDIGYIDSTFVGSSLELCLKTADENGLRRYSCYAEMAVSYHVKEQNPKQKQFFQCAVSLCKKRLTARRARINASKAGEEV